ncbi:MAG: glycosyltransferase family 4 protein [Candidatus Woesearchaeota archaeon]
MRIVLFAPEYLPQIGGMEQYAFQLAKYIRLKHDVTVFTLESNPVFAGSVPCLNSNYEHDLAIVMQYIKEKNAEIVHINNAGFAPAIPILKKLGVKVIVTVHGKDFLNPFRYAEKSSERVGGINQADRIIAVSHFLRDRLVLMGVNASKIEVMNHGTNPDLFKPAIPDNDLRKRLRIAEGGVLLTVARITRKKNILGVINILPELIDAIYLVVGPVADPVYFEEIKARIRDLRLERRVIFAGAVEHAKLPAYYNLSDVYVMASLEPTVGDIESFGISFLEASACGKPVVGSRNSGAADAIVDGKSGFLVDPSNMLGKIQLLLENAALRQKMGDVGRRLVEKEGTWQKCFEKVQELYSEVLTRVSYGEYLLDNEEFISGANLYYSEVSRLLAKSAKPHNFADVLNGQLNFCDSVVCNSGPYAHIYHYLRKKHGLRFRIIRDVQALLSSYLLQEVLCRDMLQPDDIVMFPSEYTRQLFIKIFPHINADNSCVCYPCMSFFPKVERRKHDGFNIGYVGRVGKEKNFEQLLEAFAIVAKQSDARLLVAGRVEEQAFLPDNVKSWLRNKGVDPDRYVHFNNGAFVPYEQVWEIYRDIDVLVFPSTANIETLGRVILEASSMGIPVVAAEHAAAPEVLPGSNLVGVEYFRKASYLGETCRLGKIAEKELAVKILGKLQKADISAYEQEGKLKRILGGKIVEQLKPLNENIQRFIDRIKVVGMTSANVDRYTELIKVLDYRWLRNAKLVAEKLEFRPYLQL